MANFKARFWQVGRWFGGLFILLFAFRLLHGYVATGAGSSDAYSDDFFSSIENLRKNYASEKFATKSSSVQVAATMASNQSSKKPRR